MSPTALETQPGPPTTLTDGLPLPKVIIFDLDYTLWPFWVDTHVSPPLRAQADGARAVDSTGETFSFYRDVPDILRAAHERSIPLALASRTCTPDLAEILLKKLVVQQPEEKAPLRAWDFFNYRQIFPGDKRTHMTRISKASGLAYEDMLFFDDESRNKNVQSLGVCFQLVRDGVTKHEVDAGIRKWRKQRGTKGANTKASG